jgi:hypothetical protein
MVLCTFYQGITIEGIVGHKEPSAYPAYLGCTHQPNYVTLVKSSETCKLRQLLQEVIGTQVEDCEDLTNLPSAPGEPLPPIDEQSISIQAFPHGSTNWPPTNDGYSGLRLQVSG